MKNQKDYIYPYEKVLQLVKMRSYDEAIVKIKDYIKLCVDNDDLSFAYLCCGFLNTKIKEFNFSISDFSQAIYYEDNSVIFNNRSKDIAFNGRSNSKYMIGDFKGAIDDKRQAIDIKLTEDKKKYNNSSIINYKRILLNDLDCLDLSIKNKVLILISKPIKKKYDLIEDYKKVISKEKKEEIKNNLIRLSNSKYYIGDYKASIRALRRSEKYL